MRQKLCSRLFSRLRFLSFFLTRRVKGETKYISDLFRTVGGRLSGGKKLRLEIATKEAWG